MEGLVEQALQALQASADALRLPEERAAGGAQGAAGPALVVDRAVVLEVGAAREDQVVHDPLVHLRGEHPGAISEGGIANEIVGDGPVQEVAALAADAGSEPAIAPKAPEAHGVRMARETGDHHRGVLEDALLRLAAHRGGCLTGRHVGVAAVVAVIQPPGVGARQCVEHPCAPLGVLNLAGQGVDLREHEHLVADP